MKARRNENHTLRGESTVRRSLSQSLIPLSARRWIRTGIEWLAVLVLGIGVLFPVLWMLKGSFQPLRDLLAKPPVWIPRSFYVENYVNVLRDPSVLHALRNSFIVATASTLIAMASGLLAAYAFVRFRFRGRTTLFLAVLVSQMLPGIAMVIPLYVFMNRLRLSGTFVGLILAYISFTLPYCIWLLRAYLTNAPWELEEQARVDGCSRLGAITRVVLPTIMPGLITAGIFAFLNVWNEYLFAVTLSSPTTKTFPVRLSEYINQERIALETMFAAGAIGTLPGLILIVFFGRYIVRGLTAGALKGA